MRNTRDANAPEIIQELQACGVHVQDMSNYGHGFPDILCMYQNKITLLEIKTADGELSEKQKKFFDIAMRHNCRCYVVRTPEQALKRVGVAENIARNILMKVSSNNSCLTFGKGETNENNS